MSDSHKQDPAVPFMALDIIQGLMKHSGKLYTTTSFLTNEIRELTGSKLVILVQWKIKENGKPAFDVIDFAPRRREKLALSPEVNSLLEYSHCMDKVSTWSSNEHGNFPAKMCAELGFETNIVGPLFAGDAKFGTLLALGLQDSYGLEYMLETMEIMLGTVALILSNIYLMAKQESIIEQRTKELREAKDVAEQANKSKSEFLANMSHEIRTPMNAVLGFSEILKTKETDQQKQHYINSICSAGRALLSLINDVLDLSKIEAGKLELTYGVVSLTNLLDEMNVLFEQQIGDKGLEFVIDSHKSVPPALILDETRLRQVLINLLGNAVKFTDAGHIHVSLSAQSAESSLSCIDLILCVEDTGIGIPQDQQDSIFGDFEQVSGSVQARFGGTGLGLAITKRLVEKMNGHITVDSIEGRGSTFRLILHEVDIAAGGTVEEAMRKQLDVNTVSFEPATILIVDDIDYNREVLSTYLEPFDLNCIPAKNGREAIEKAEQHHPDVILLDMKMPVMGGHEAAEIMKGTDSLKDIPIVAVTASALKQEEIIISQLCDGYMHKPVSQSDLLGMLMRFLPHTILDAINIVPEESTKLYDDRSVTACLTSLPTELVDQLQEALVLLDVERINVVINMITECDHTLGDTLKSHADSFDYGRLRECLVSAEETTEDQR
jgi:signal transduction histidine kinase/DNA-binding NarL/FixJ family response regulator